MRIKTLLEKINPAFFVPYVGVFIGLDVMSSGWMALLFYHTGIVYALLMRKPRMDVSLFSPPRPAMVVLSCIPFLSTGLFIWLLWPLSSIPGIRLEQVLDRFGLEGFSLYAFGVYFVVVNPVLEELFWRQFEDESAIRYINDPLYAGYHAIILAHVLQPVYCIGAIIVLVLAGVFWRYVTNRHASNFLSVVTHAAADFSIVIAVFAISEIP